MSTSSSRPKILIARQIFPEGIARLEAFCDIDYVDQIHPLTKEELTQRLKGKAGALVTGSERIDAQTLADASDLKIVANIAVGFNNFDLEVMNAKGIIGTNTPDVLTDTTADMAFTLLMAISRRISEAERWLRAGKWEHWEMGGMLGVDIHHSTLGIMGMGRIGQAIAKRGLAFGMKIIYHNRSPIANDLETACQASYVDKETLLKQADHVMLVMPYTPESHHLIGAKELAMMKSTATLVNIARGGIVDDSALIEALKNHQIFGAGLDVFEGEPNFNPEFLTLPNVVLAPHIGSATSQTRHLMMNLAIDNLLASLQGQQPKTMVNPQVWKG